MIKKIINSKYFRKFREAYILKIYNDIYTEKYSFCCHSANGYRLIICWKKLKEVEENMSSKMLNTLDIYNCKLPWFYYKEDRLKFLEECLNKF